jgi:predicted CoA-binding protein
VNDLLEVRSLLASSSDPGNPTAEELRDLLRSVNRIAVVGLSRFPEKAARRVPSYLAAKGYELVPVNPHADTIFGRRAYARLGDVPGEVDLVVIFRPSAVAGEFVTEAADRPERPPIWLQEGIRADPEIALARARGTTAIQDLCVFRVHRSLED